MSGGIITVSNALTGEVVKADPDRFISLEAFKQWIKESQKIPEEYQLLLTARGITQLKLEAIADGQEVFLFDKSLISPGGGKEVERIGGDDEGSVKSPTPPPATFNPNTPLSDRFISHSKWALECLEIGNQCIKRKEDYQSAMNVIKKGLNTSIEHMIRHSLGLKKSFDSKVDFAVDLDLNMQSTGEWEVYLEKVKKIEVLEVFRESANDNLLSCWIDESVIRKAYSECTGMQLEIQNQISHLMDRVTEVVNESNRLQSDGSEMASKDPEADVPSNCTTRHVRELLQDLNALTNKIQRDSESVLTVPEQTGLRIENLHKREFFPQITAIVEELISISDEWRNAKLKCQTSAIKYLSILSHIQYKTSMIRPDLQKLAKVLQTTEDLRATVAQVIDLPFLYGALIIETIRRNRWNSFIKENISETAERLAGKRLDEIKRRLKWKSHYGEIFPKVVNIINGDIPEIDISFVDKSNDESSSNSLSDINSDHAQTYIKTLIDLGLTDHGEELEQEHQSMITQFESIINESERPEQSEQPTSTTISDKIFKSGSLTDAYTDERASLNSKIKGYESRIRILEDLLHKQQFRGDSNQQTNGREKSRSPSSGSPRLIERLHFLEVQKTNDSKIISQLEEEKRQLSESLSSTEAALNDAKTVKTDLLANMISQETEFTKERKTYLEEINDLKNRIEELELELDRGDENLQQENDQLKEDLQIENTRLKEIEEENKRLKQENTNLQRKVDMYDTRTRDLSQRLFTGYKRSCEVLESMGLQASKEMDGNLPTFKVNRVRGLGRRTSAAARSELLDPSTEDNNGDGPINPSTENNSLPPTSPADLKSLYWMDGDPNDVEERYREFINEIYIDYDIFRDNASKRLRDVEHLARKLQREAKQLRERKDKTDEELQSCLSLRSFKVGDLALFLPTRDPTRVPNPWAAFNVNAPHYFLKQEESHQLSNREYLVGRITHIEEKVVNKAEDNEEDNPFDLSDGLRWYLLDAVPAEW